MWRAQWSSLTSLPADRTASGDLTALPWEQVVTIVISKQPTIWLWWLPHDSVGFFPKSYFELFCFLFCFKSLFQGMNDLVFKCDSLNMKSAFVSLTEFSLANNPPSHYHILSQRIISYGILSTAETTCFLHNDLCSMRLQRWSVLWCCSQGRKSPEALVASSVIAWLSVLAHPLFFLIFRLWDKCSSLMDIPKKHHTM